MRVAKPTTNEQQPVSRSLRRERRRWDDADQHSLALGCLGCHDRPMCGGQHKKQNHYSCIDDCCNNPDKCDSVCPRNMLGFIERMREINGFDYANVESAAPCASPADVSSYVPMIFHGNRREKNLDMDTVAVPLHKLYSRRDGSLRYKTPADLAAVFRVRKGARIIAIGSGRDKPIEAWWGLSAARKNVIAGLRDLGVVMVTSPNYSVFTDQPRYDDMYNQKRILVAWQEFLAGKMPSSLHLNARTIHDYKRIAEFIDIRDEVSDVSFEFKTGAAWRGRRDFHYQHLAEVGRGSVRPLRLTMVGGISALPVLVPHYRGGVIYIDTTAFMGTLHRQRLFEGNDGKISKVPELTATGAPLDDLFIRNIEVMRRRVERIISESRPEAA